jgi:hypothetical protein
MKKLLSLLAPKYFIPGPPHLGSRATMHAVGYRICGIFIGRLMTTWTAPSAEHEAQIKSFAYGNVHMSNESVTREHIERAYEKLRRKRA